MPERTLLLALGSILVVALDLWVGAFVLRSNPGSRRNRLFFAVCVSLAIWSFGYTFLPSAAKERTWFWLAVSSPGWTITPALLLHFCLDLSRAQRWLRKRWLLVAVYLPSLFYFTEALRGSGHMGVVDFVATPWGWSDVYGPLTLSYAGYLAYFSSYITIGLAFIWRWGRSSELERQKRQARLIVFSGVPVLALVSLSGIFLPWWGIRSPPEIAHWCAALWVLAIGNAVSRYQLMAMTPQRAAQGILGAMADALILVDHRGWITEVNAACERLFGRRRQELLGLPVDRLFPTPGSVLEDVLSHLRDADTADHLELDYTQGDGPTIPLQISAARVRDELGQDSGTVLIARDITETMMTQQQLRFAATHDPLTGLPNRSLLDDRLRLALARAQRAGKGFALLLFDVDRFKDINDSLGHATGDEVLQAVARKLLHCARGADTVARFGGDEFLLLLEDLSKPSEAEIIAQRIMRSLSQPVDLQARQIQLSASIGIAVYPLDASDGESLLRRADLALFASKAVGGGAVRFYTEDLEAANRERLVIESLLPGAVERGEFSLAFQPLVDFRSGAIVGAEALARWTSPELGQVSPASFIPVAESLGVIDRLGQWVLDAACRQCRAWQQAGVPPIRMAVNVSARQLRDPDFPARVMKTLRLQSVHPALLELELTEQAAMDNIETARAALEEIAARGIRVVIDDFGTGYSSLRRLRDLPIHAIKIDRSFIKQIQDHPKDRALVTASIAVARSLGVDVIAEGIETVEQLEALSSLEVSPTQALRCDLVQGYLFSRPVDAGRIPALMRSAEIDDDSPFARIRELVRRFRPPDA